MDFQENGKFAPGNQVAHEGGKARAAALSPERRREIARAGFDAMVARRGGNVSEVMRNLVRLQNPEDAIFFGQS